MREHHVTIQGLRMRYLRAGTGAPLILLHGGSWGERAEASWSAVFDRFAAARDVIAPDWLGFGGSDKVRDFAAPEDRMVGQLSGLLAQLGVGGGDVVAVSMGGSLVLRDLASPRPLLAIRRLVLVSAGGAPMRPQAREQLFAYDGSREGMRAIIELVHHGPRFAADDAYVDRWHAWSLEAGVYEAFAAAGLRSPRATPPAATDLGRITTPTLVCAGAHDRLKDPGWERDVVARLPAGRDVRFHHSGHLPQVEEPGAFADHVLAFLDEPDSGARELAQPVPGKGER